MAQRRETGEPQGRLRRRLRLIGARERIEVAVGEREEHDIRRRLAEIDRFDRFVERADLDAGDVHGTSGAERRGDRVAVDALLRDHDEAALARLAGAPRPVEVAAEPLADALHQQAHRLAGDLDEALDAQDVVRARHVG